jgi:hypothetical protein
MTIQEYLGSPVMVLGTISLIMAGVLVWLCPFLMPVAACICWVLIKDIRHHLKTKETP